MRFLRPLIALSLACGFATPILDARETPTPDALPAVEGIVKPARQVVLKAPLVAKVKEILVDEAQQVEQGTLLVQLDDAVQAAMVAHAEAAQKLADLALQSTRDIHRSHAATDFELRRAELEAEQAAATLRLEQARLAQYRVEAPFRGHVVRIQAREGATVGEDDAVLVFAELDPLEAEFHLPAACYRDLRVGQAYELAAGPPVNDTLTATCKTIEPLLDPASATFRCVFTIENAETQLPAGFAVRMEAPTASLVSTNASEPRP